MIRRLVVAAAVVSLLPALAPDLAAQGRAVSDAECKDLRQRLGDHARVSTGARALVAARAAPAPAPAPAAPPGGPSTRADAVRARLAQIPDERQRAEDARLAAMVRLDFNRASRMQSQIDALDKERADLQRELATLPAAPPPPSAPTSDAERVACADAPALLEAVVKARQKELGAREGQPGAVPLLPLRAADRDGIARELASQLAAWPESGRQVGLLDQDGDGRLDAFVDVPADGVLRLYRQRADGTLGIDVFVVPGRGVASAYDETMRRLEETAAKQGAWPFATLLAIRPAGPVRTVGETADFAKALGFLLAGNFAEAGRVAGGVARTLEYPNLRGETVRAMDVIAPVTGGVAWRRLVVLPATGGQETWEEMATQVRPQSPWRSDVEVAMRRETRAAGGGAPVGQPSAPAPIRFTLER